MPPTTLKSGHSKMAIHHIPLDRGLYDRCQGYRQLVCCRFPRGMAETPRRRLTAVIDPEGPVSSPPPPYSPNADEPLGRQDPGSNLSPADSARHSSFNSTPTSAYLPASPHLPGTSQFAPPRQSSTVRNSSTPTVFPPPPPLRPNARHSSRLGNLLTGVANRRNTTFSPGQGITPSSLPSHSVVQYEPSPPPPSIPMPPAGRRAASVGVVSTASSSSRPTSHADNRSPSQDRRWERSRPLPGPPPGPPPNSSRSQSASGVGDATARNLLAPAPRPKARQAPALGTSLDPVPPTPAGWVEDGTFQDLNRGVGNLHVDTAGLTGSTIAPVESNTDSSQSQPNTGSGLNRSSAFRGPSAKGLRERRTATRSTRMSITDLSALSINSNNPWPNSVRSSPQARQDRHRLDTAETTPDDVVDREHRKAVGLSPADTEHTTSTGSQHSTPKAVGSATFKIPAPYVSQTPPWSAGTGSSSPAIQTNPSTFMHAKSLPTPPLVQSRRLSGPITRPISHILHSPIDETSIPSLSPSIERRARTFTRPQSGIIDLSEDEAFMAECNRRHETFLRAERAAPNDSAKLQLFADYILEESRIRRNRYIGAFTSNAFDAQAIRNGLFEQKTPSQRRASGVLRLVTTSSEAIESPREPDSRSGVLPGSAYQPALSPIMSMGDELSSRGRAPSRWWESQPSSDSDGQRKALERSTRESKYMGVSRKAREAIQRDADQHTVNDAVPSYSAEAAEYPPEKQDISTLGFYDDGQPSPAFQSNSKLPGSPRRLDISRFITLPPPYPRHHPAVNNNHPDLVDYRTAVRNMSDLSDVSERRTRYQQSVNALRTEHRRRMSDSRRTFKSEIREQVEAGSLSYAEAAEAEQAMQLEEHDQEKKAVKQEYDEFTDVVLNPLHNMLNGRVQQLDLLISGLQHKLVTDAQSPNPDHTQEAGDEEPELLEKLTQLKWLFETREQVHREIFNLLTQRNETYKEILLLPYRQINNTDKLRSTDAFFVQDNQERLATFENEALMRYQKFYAIVEDNVTRGVEMQSSTFWDIAPGLEDLLQKIPEQLHDFEGIQIPETEFAENQAYRDHPLQYLYSLLLHAERSTYQFIEAQVNLHCLLHEVKGSVVTARFRALGSDDSLGSERKAQEEEDLTRELQQKVSMVEDIWTEALGSQIQGTRARVRQHLEKEGGWCDEIEVSGS